MRLLLLLFTLLASISLWSQDYYDKARSSFNDDELDSARFYIRKSLQKNPSSEDYFLSGMIHEAEGRPLRALADYEAVIKKDPNNIEAFFQKGLIYYNSSATDQAIKDFTYVIENWSSSETKAIYYASDPQGAKGGFLTTLQTMVGRVYQYRGLAFQKIGNEELALDDFNKAFEYDTITDYYINRSQLFSKMGQRSNAIKDLKQAISLEPRSYVAWYNLALIDESALLPDELLSDDSFAPLLNLMGANAYESGEYARSAEFFTKAIEANSEDDLALIGRGKSLLRMKEYQQARNDFLKAMQLNPQRTEAIYLTGNSFFYEKEFKDAVGFYDQYLSIDQGYANVWYNAAMAYLSLKNEEQACIYLRNAANLGMKQADTMLEKQCSNQ